MDQRLLCVFSLIDDDNSGEIARSEVAKIIAPHALCGKGTMIEAVDALVDDFFRGMDTESPKFIP